MGTLIQLPGGSMPTGIIGIPDGSGWYIFYTSLRAAMTAATAGDTIIFFDSYTESVSGTITLKDGVNINLNGHKYTYDVADTTNMFDTVGPMEASFYNGVLERTNATGAALTEGCVFLLVNDVSLYFYDVESINATKLLFHKVSGLINTKIYGGRWLGGNGSTAIDVSGCEIINCTFETEYVVRLNFSRIVDCTCFTTGTAAQSANVRGQSEIINCNFQITNPSNNQPTVFLDNSEMKSSIVVTKGTGFGISAENSEVYDCYTESVNFAALRLRNGSYAKDCTVITQNNEAASVDESELHSSSVSSGSSFAVCYVTDNSLIYNCYFKSTDASAAGGVVYLQLNGNQVLNCTLDVDNTGKYGITGNSGISATIVKNTGNMLTGQLVNTMNISNNQVYTQDNFGNIIIG
tara:strand:+ start:8066 stop:9286 length:1221 start_codon:yes stop_codon:yes gene_type:complete